MVFHNVQKRQAFENELKNNQPKNKHNKDFCQGYIPTKAGRYTLHHTSQRETGHTCRSFQAERAIDMPECQCLATHSADALRILLSPSADLLSCLGPLLALFASLEQDAQRV